MHIERQPAISFFGTPSGLPDVYRVRLTKRERAALERATAIREQARDLIKATFIDLHPANGAENYEMSDLYVIDVDDLIDGVGWNEWPADERSTG